MKTMENSLPRKYFSCLLERICASLCKKSKVSISWQDPYFKTAHECDLVVNRVWVVSSFAKGDSHCIYLEIVAEVTTEANDKYSGMLSIPVINRTLFCNFPSVRLYVGTPSSNTSGTQFNEAIQIWGNEVTDSFETIHSIAEN
ncbi:hypothetical protein ACUHMQ_03460 [Chitinimonas sp. PSY-7]|uniref:hypothetical protein n=1 Tax=Chitinimonas sp. PSY-7 TaxID=3459088 RepID=UPI0040402FC7